MKTRSVYSTSTLDPGLDWIVCWVPFNFNGKDIAWLSNKSSKGSNTSKSPTVQAAKLSLPTSLTVTSNCLDGLKLLSVGIPTAPPTPIVKTWSWP